MLEKRLCIHPSYGKPLAFVPRALVLSELPWRLIDHCTWTGQRYLSPQKQIAESHSYDIATLSFNMSVDAKLAAQAAAGLTSSSNPSAAASARAPSSSSSNSNTPKLQQAQAHQQSHVPHHAQQQQQHAAPPPHQQPIPHSHHRSKKEEYLLLSLPSHDSTLLAHHNNWETGEDTGFYGSDEGEDSDWTEATMCPPLTNRGNKLAPGARFVRKGRLGGWENREFFDGNHHINSSNKLGFKGASSSLSKPTIEGTDALLADEVKRPQNGLPGGKDVYPITPNLTFVPSSSTAAARPDREAPAYSFLPGPNSPTSPSALSPRKRKKVYSSYTGLASTSGSTSNHTSAPVRAYLPAPPQNPIELVMSPLVTRTFSPRNNSLEKLALHPTDLIERDLPLVKALTRVVDVLRGTTVAGLDGTLGLPFSNDDEPVIQAYIKDKTVEEAEQEIEAEIKSAKEAEAEYLHNKKSGKQTDSTSAAAAADGMEVDGQAEADKSADEPSRKRRRTASMEVDATESNTKMNGLDNAAPVLDGTAVDASVGTATVAAAETAEVEMQEDAKPTEEAFSKDGPVVNGTEAVKLEASLKGLAPPIDTSTSNAEEAKTAEQAMSSNEAVHDKAESGVVAETSTNAEADAATTEVNAAAVASAVPASVTASRRNSPVSAAGDGEEDNESMADTAAEGSTSSTSKYNTATRLPASLQRIANPAPYVSSLFVTPRDVLVGIPPGAPGSIPGQPNAPVPGGYQWIDILLPNGTPRFVYRNPPKPSQQAGQQQPEASTSASGSTSTAADTQSASTSNGAAAGTSSQARTSTPVSTYPEYRKLTPAEQQEAVHLCTQELTKFLSDTLEYRDRLGEIRDSILGVEKRRKGVWTMARSYAHQLLWEEEQDRIANGM